SPASDRSSSPAMAPSFSLSCAASPDATRSRYRRSLGCYARRRCPPIDALRTQLATRTSTAAGRAIVEALLVFGWCRHLEHERSRCPAAPQHGAVRRAVAEAAFRLPLAVHAEFWQARLTDHDAFRVFLAVVHAAVGTGSSRRCGSRHSGDGESCHDRT